MIVINFFRNIIGAIIFAAGGLLVMLAYLILAPTGRKWIKQGVLTAVVEHLTGTPATTSKDVVVARVEPREEQ